MGDIEWNSGRESVPKQEQQKEEEQRPRKKLLRILEEGMLGSERSAFGFFRCQEPSNALCEWPIVVVVFVYFCISYFLVFSLSLSLYLSLSLSLEHSTTIKRSTLHFQYSTFILICIKTHF